VATRVVYSGVGGISEADLTLAKASGALIIGFNVRANPQAREIAKRDKVDIRYYSIIYKVTEDIQALMIGLLDPTYKETFLGNAQIREVFRITKGRQRRRTAWSRKAWSSAAPRSVCCATTW